MLVRSAALVLLVTAMASIGYGAAPTASDLRLSIDALMRIRDTAQKNLDQNLSTSDRFESSQFITFLSSRIQADCQALMQLAPGAIAGLPCTPASLNSATAYRETISQGELVADLDRQFHGQLQDFDDMLLAEHETIGSAAGTGAGSSGEGATGGGTGDQSTPGDDRSAQGATGQNEPAVYPGPCPDGEECGQNLPPQAGDDQLGKDDDIVARQLREAAEQERDPELKEKLWEEYYRYKNSGAAP
jgi:hypothetical protein